jgi:hypothetical protein
MEEIWKDIPCYELLYKASSTGKIYSYKSRKILKAGINVDGYLQINLVMLQKFCIFAL